MKRLQEQLIEIKKRISGGAGITEEEASLKIDNILREAPQPLFSESKKRRIVVKEKKRERLSERELADLMGSNRPTYGRAKGGSFRQR